MMFLCIIKEIIVTREVCPELIRMLICKCKLEITFLGNVVCNRLYIKGLDPAVLTVSKYLFPA